MARLARVVAVTALAVVGSLFAVSPAQAVVIDVACGAPSSNVITFSPPLTLVNQPTVVTRSTKYQNCAPPLSPGVITGQSIKTVTILDDCTMVLLPGTVVHTITWNTAPAVTTTMTMNRTASISGSSLIVKFVGSVTAGKFLGSRVDQTYVGPAQDLINCLNGVGAVRQLNSRVTLRIYH